MTYISIYDKFKEENYNLTVYFLFLDTVLFKLITIFKRYKYVSRINKKNFLINLILYVFISENKDIIFY